MRTEYIPVSVAMESGLVAMESDSVTFNLVSPAADR